MYVNKVNGYFIYVHCTLYTVHCTLYSILLHYTRTYYTVHYVNTVNGYFIYSILLRFFILLKNLTLPTLIPVISAGS